MNGLTKEQVMAMDPIELNLAIAEHVFKAKTIGRDIDDSRMLVGYFPEMKPLNGKSWRNADWRLSEERAWEDCPKYAEDISAAWEVVEKMRETHKRKFTNAMYEIMNPNREAFQIAPIDLIWYMNPLNICRAALLAVMDG